MVRANPSSTSVKSCVSRATCITLFLSEEYAIKAVPSSSCMGTSVFGQNRADRHAPKYRSLGLSHIGSHQSQPRCSTDAAPLVIDRAIEMFSECCKRSYLEDCEVSTHVPVRPKAAYVREGTCMQQPAQNSSTCSRHSGQQRRLGVGFASVAST